MKLLKLKAHPAAELFPMLGGRELEQLADDIEKNGQHDPIIVTSENLVLDGRNRLAACELRGIEPDIQMWDREDDGISPTAWVIGKNLRRRHLDSSQAALVAAAAIPLFAKEAKARQLAGRKETLPPAGGKVGTAASAAAESTGVGARSVERAAALMKKAPAAEIEKIRAGEKTLKQVERELKRKEQIDQIRAYTPPVGEYAVISADPPWQYDDQLDGSDQARGGCPYPTMPLADICALKVPAAADCILWLWCTNAFLADGSAAAVVKAWGFESKTILTWVKPKIGVGRWLRNSTEHCILAVKGAPKVDLTNESTMLMAPVGEHSAKPDLFYRMVEKLCPSPSRVELFARAERAGWVTSGAEIPKSKRKRLQIEDVEAA